jgi:hypothetical protein
LSSLDLGGVEVGVVLLVRAILLFLSLLVFVVFVVFLLLEGLAGEKEDGAGDDALTDVVTDLKVCSEQVLRNSKQFRLIERMNLKAILKETYVSVGVYQNQSDSYKRCQNNSSSL